MRIALPAHKEIAFAGAMNAVREPTGTRVAAVSFDGLAGATVERR